MDDRISGQNAAGHLFGEENAMNEPLTLSIPVDKSFVTLPMDRVAFYLNLLAAVADEATEVRCESREGYGRVFYNVGGVESEMSPIAQEVAEQEIRSLVLGSDRRERSDEIPFRLDIGGKMTDAIASIGASAVVIRFLAPGTASSMAAKILYEHVDRLKRGEGLENMTLSFTESPGGPEVSEQP
jgi:hypothetical protein